MLIIKVIVNNFSFVCVIQLGVPVCNALLAFGLGKYDEVRSESFMPFKPYLFWVVLQR